MAIGLNQCHMTSHDSPPPPFFFFLVDLHSYPAMNATKFNRQWREARGSQVLYVKGKRCFNIEKSATKRHHNRKVCCWDKLDESKEQAEESKWMGMRLTDDTMDIDQEGRGGRLNGHASIK